MRRPTVAQRRAEILEVTCAVVVERGFAHTRVADVASRLGVSTGLIHYHFDSKEQLLAEAFQYAAAADLARLDRVVAEEGSALAKLDRVVRLNTPVEAETGWILWIDAWGEALRSKELRAISQDLDLRWKQTIETIVRMGVASGEFRCADPDAAAWRLAALLDGLGLQLTVHDGVIGRHQMLAWVREAAVLELGLASDAFDQLDLRRDGDGGPRP